jgi:hypothetical protein
VRVEKEFESGEGKSDHEREKINERLIEKREKKMVKNISRKRDNIKINLKFKNRKKINECQILK